MATLETDIPVTPSIYTIFTLGQPGLGKSYLIKKIRENLEKNPKIAVQVCTSDEARSRVLAVAYKVNNVDVTKLSQEEIYKIEADNALAVRLELFSECEDKIG